LFGIMLPWHIPGGTRTCAGRVACDLKHSIKVGLLNLVGGHKRLHVLLEAQVAACKMAALIPPHNLGRVFLPKLLRAIELQRIAQDTIPGHYKHTL
jgi:hypothetical protein